jgi:hypothetical protein
VSVPPGLLHNYRTLAQSPVVSSVWHLSGPTAGGTPVVLLGSLFAGSTMVLFVELNASGALTGSSSECAWRGLRLQRHRGLVRACGCAELWVGVWSWEWGWECLWCE